MKTHTCPGGCDRRVPRHHFACPDCWGRLPADLQCAIAASYMRDPATHVEALLDACSWYGDHPLATPVPAAPAGTTAGGAA